ncbi:MAG: polysaccharide biosynthesis/export family protein [Longimicrobiales bacterium]
MKRLPTVVSLLMMATFSTSPVSAQANTSVVLRAGDLVNLTIWPDPEEYSGEYRVGTDGLLALPFVGEILAAGIPVDQLQADIRNGYQQTRNEVVVSVNPAFAVGVMGQVRNPSVYYATANQNLFDVVAMAGGFLATADLNKVRIVRDREVIPVDALYSLETGVDLNRYRLRSGDQLLVPASGGLDLRTVFEIVRTVSTIILVVDRLRN